MKKFHSLNLLAVAVASVLALTACGGSDSDSNSTSSNVSAQTKTATGVFLDSAVQGVEVIQDGKSLGFTNEKGEYTYYVNGGAVSFKLGNLTLGSTAPKSVITPADLQVDGGQIERILQILQSVDSDGNADNGIQIDKTVAGRFDASDFASLVQEENDTTFENLLKPKLNNNQSVVTVDNALAHFEKTIQSDKVTNSPDLAKVADQLVGYWEQSCDDGRKEVFQLVKVNATTVKEADKLVFREYENNDCTGNYTEETGTSNYQLTIKVIGESNDNGTKVTHTYLTETQNGKTDANFIKLTWNGNNSFSDNNLTMTRATSLAFNQAVVTPVTNDIKTTVNSLQGYWESSCDADEKQFGTTKYQSSKDFTYLTKTADDTITATKSIGVFYTNANCTGNTFVMVDTRPETHQLSNPQTINGKTSYAVTNSDGDRLVLNSNTQFTVGNEVNYKTSQSTFDSWIAKANYTTDNNKTVPVVNDLQFTPASNGQLAKLTATFNTNMNIMDYWTTGAYDPAKSYWLDNKTFVVEFNSYVPNGSITLVGQKNGETGFENSGGVVMAEDKTFTFPNN